MNFEFSNLVIVIISELKKKYNIEQKDIDNLLDYIKNNIKEYTNDYVNMYKDDIEEKCRNYIKSEINDAISILEDLL